MNKRIELPTPDGYTPEQCFYDAYDLITNNETVYINKITKADYKMYIFITGGYIAQYNLEWTGPNNTNPNIPAYYNIPYKVIGIK